MKRVRGSRKSGIRCLRNAVCLLAVLGGLALAPVSKLAIEWEGHGDEVDASKAERNLHALADEWSREIFATA